MPCTYCQPTFPLYTWTYPTASAATLYSTTGRWWTNMRIPLDYMAWSFPTRTSPRNLRCWSTRATSMGFVYALYHVIWLRKGGVEKLIVGKHGLSELCIRISRAFALHEKRCEVFFFFIFIYAFILPSVYPFFSPIFWFGVHALFPYSCFGVHALFPYSGVRHYRYAALDLLYSWSRPGAWRWELLATLGAAVGPSGWLPHPLQPLTLLRYCSYCGSWGA